MSEGTGTHIETAHEAPHGGTLERAIAGGGQLTIETIADVARQIRQALAEADTIVIDLSDTTEMDITALQLFCSACRTAAAAGKRFIHRGPLPQSLLDLAAAVGSERLEHCKNNNPTCFREFGGME